MDINYKWLWPFAFVIEANPKPSWIKKAIQKEDAFVE